VFGCGGTPAARCIDTSEPTLRMQCVMSVAARLARRPRVTLTEAPVERENELDGAAMRRIRAWALPIVTFVGIGAFMITVLVIRAVSGTSDADTANAFAGPLEPARHVNTRQWRTIAADPLGHAEQRVVLWGRVTRFDPTTDASSFRANVDAARHTPQNGVVNYPTSVIMHGDPDVLRKLAQGFIFTAEATVDGTVPPGETPDARIPRLTVTKLTVTDKTVG
jgi:hypothetical protein